MSKNIIRCKNCSKCGVQYSFGFNHKQLRFCSLLEQEVDSDDGCTFGHRGKNYTLKRLLDVEISGYAAVSGYSEF